MSKTYIAWMEWPNQDLSVESWRLYAYDASHRTTLLVARAVKPGAKPRPALPGYGSPELVTNKLFWPKVVPRGSGFQINMYMCSLPRCVPKKVDTGVAYPSQSAGKVYWARSDIYLGNRKARSFKAIQFDPTTGQERVVASLTRTTGSDVDGLGASESHVAWTESTSSGRSTAQILDTRTNQKVTIHGVTGVEFGVPIVTDRFVLLPDGGGGSGADFGGYLYRFSDHRLYGVGNESGLSAMTADSSCLTWEQRTGGTPAAPAVSWKTACLSG